MRKLMLYGVLLALSVATVAQQAATTGAAGTGSQSAVPSSDSAAGITVSGPLVAGFQEKWTSSDPSEQKIAKEVRHELLMLPYYSLFDTLGFSVQGRTVTLTGTLTSRDAVTQSDAENVIKHIEGVEKVVNNIKVLPPSPMDDRIRERTFQTLVRTGGLSKYFWEAAPSIHIIVENGRVTLDGYVMNEGDKDMAGIAANTVPGTFKVTNNLRVVKG